MKLGNHMLLWFIAILTCMGAFVALWSPAFAYLHDTVLPSLEVLPPQYYKLAAAVGAFVVDGLGVLLAFLILTACGFGAAALNRLIKR